jgi:hypothetical protein
MSATVAADAVMARAARHRAQYRCATTKSVLHVRVTAA